MLFLFFTLLPLLLPRSLPSLCHSLSLPLSVTHRTLIPFDFYSLLFSLLQAFVRFSARRMDTMAAAFATARMAGRVPNATYRLGSARCPIAPAMDAALRASAVASAAGRDPTAINVSVKGGAGRLSLSDFALSLPPLPLCAVLTWHKNAKIIYLPCLQFRAVFTPRRHVDTAPIRHTHTHSHTLCEGCGPG